MQLFAASDRVPLTPKFQIGCIDTPSITQIDLRALPYGPARGSVAEHSGAGGRPSAKVVVVGFWVEQERGMPPAAGLRALHDAPFDSYHENLIKQGESSK